MKSVKLKTIGYVSSPIAETLDENWGTVTSRILLTPAYTGALSGLEDFSHAIIVTYLHQAHFNAATHLRRKPRNLETMPRVGIFSQRAKDRPNPIGITAVEIISVGVSDGILKNLMSADIWTDIAIFLHIMYSHQGNEREISFLQSE